MLACTACLGSAEEIRTPPPWHTSSVPHRRCRPWLSKGSCVHCKVLAKFQIPLTSGSPCSSRLCGMYGCCLLLGARQEWQQWLALLSFNSGHIALVTTPVPGILH